MKEIRYCRSCRLYTLLVDCPSCSSKTVVPKPAKYSPDDHYASYRRKAKEAELREKGWL